MQFMEKEIDLRGLACPEPVIRTKRLLDDKSIIKVEALVESEVNVKNLARLARSQSVSMSCSNEGDFYRVVFTKGDKTPLNEAEELAVRDAQKETNKHRVGTVVFLSKDTFGEGDRDFSLSLLNVFLQTLFDSGHRPRAILMANSGVKLMDPEGSVLPVLNSFAEAGCEVLACGLCLEHYTLKDKVPVDQITNMFTICEYLMTADRVVTP
jgi:tRNA 2-thiouridine synthesizing protein A